MTDLMQTGELSDAGSTPSLPSGLGSPTSASSPTSPSRPKGDGSSFKLFLKKVATSKFPTPRSKKDRKPGAWTSRSLDDIDTKTITSVSWYHKPINTYHGPTICTDQPGGDGWERRRALVNTQETTHSSGESSDGDSTAAYALSPPSARSESLQRHLNDLLARPASAGAAPRSACDTPLTRPASAGSAVPVRRSLYPSRRAPPAAAPATPAPTHLPNAHRVPTAAPAAPSPATAPAHSAPASAGRSKPSRAAATAGSAPPVPAAPLRGASSELAASPGGTRAAKHDDALCRYVSSFSTEDNTPAAKDALDRRISLDLETPPTTPHPDHLLVESNYSAAFFTPKPPTPSGSHTTEPGFLLPLPPKSPGSSSYSSHAALANMPARHLLLVPPSNSLDDHAPSSCPSTPVSSHPALFQTPDPSPAKPPNLRLPPRTFHKEPPRAAAAHHDSPSVPGTPLCLPLSFRNNSDIAMLSPRPAPPANSVSSSTRASPTKWDRNGAHRGLESSQSYYMRRLPARPHAPLWSTLDAWATPLLGPCHAPGGASNGLASIFCAPCKYGDIVGRLDREDTVFGGQAAPGCLAFAALAPCCLHVPLHLSLRRAIRSKYSMQNQSAFQDIVVVCACTPCALAQEYNEVLKRQTSAASPKAASSSTATVSTTKDASTPVSRSHWSMPPATPSPQAAS